MIDALKFSTLQLHARNTIKRFPFLSLLSFCGFIIILLYSQKPSGLYATYLEHASEILGFIFVFAAPFILAAERLNKSHRLTSLICILLGVTVWALMEWELTPKYFNYALIVSSAVLFFVSPFLKDPNNDRLCDFWFKMIIATIWSIIPCAILSMAIGVIHFAFDKLFGIKFTDFVNAFLYGGVWSLVFPLLFYGQLPTPAQIDSIQECVAPKPLKIIITWLLVPIAFTFFAVLYCYFVKIAITQENVRGILVGLIIGYSVFGLFVVLSSYPLIREENKLVGILHKYFFYILIVPILILVWRIYVRIDAYGLTEDRILSAVFALWLLAVAVTFSFKTIAQRQLRLIPMTIAFVILVLYSGPWHPLNFSLYSQKEKLTAALQKEGLYDGNKIVVKEPKTTIKSLHNQKVIIGALDYFSSKNRLDYLESLFDKTVLNDYQSYKVDYGFSRYNTYGKVVLNRIAMTIVENDTTNQNNNAYLNFSDRYDYSDQVIPMTGYDFYIDNVSLYKSNSGKHPSFQFQDGNQTKTLRFIMDPNWDMTIIVDVMTDEEKKERITLDFAPSIQAAIKEKQQFPSKIPKDVFLEGNSDHYAIKIQLKNWNGNIIDNNDLKLKTDNASLRIWMKRLN